MAKSGISACKHCGEDFFRKTGRFKYCSVRCRVLARTVVDPVTGCLIWTGPIGTSNPYPVVTIGNQKDGTKRPHQAHRVIWEAECGPLSENEQLDHRICRNKRCLNVGHMVVCTLLENIFQPDGAPAINAAKTHCPHGHEYAGDNLIEGLQKGNCRARRCRACYENHYKEFSRKRSLQRAEKRRRNR